MSGLCDHIKIISYGGDFSSLEEKFLNNFIQRSERPSVLTSNVVGFILHCTIKKSFSLCDFVTLNRQILGYLSTWQYSRLIFVNLTLQTYSRKGLEMKGIKKNRPLKK